MGKESRLGGIYAKMSTDPRISGIHGTMRTEPRGRTQGELGITGREESPGRRAGDHGERGVGRKASGGKIHAKMTTDRQSPE